MTENTLNSSCCLSARPLGNSATDVAILKSDTGICALKFCDKNRLTPRQVDVLLNLLQGLFNKEIAHHLKISEATVKSHTGAIMRLCGCRNRTELVLKVLLGDLPSLKLQEGEDVK